MSVSLVALMMLFVLAILGLVVLAGVIAAIRHGRWGVLLGLGVVLALPMLFVLLMVGVKVSEERPVPTATASVSTLTSDSHQYVQHTVEAADKEFATTNRYTNVNSDEPPIQVDAKEATDKEAADAETEAVAVETNADPPDWIDAQTKLHDKVFAAGPFVTKPQCKEDTRRQILAWLAEKAGVTAPEARLPAVEAILDDVVRRTHLSKRETSVGTVYLQYTRAHSDKNIVEAIRQEVRGHTAIAQRQRGRKQLVIGGGLLLGTIGLLHGLLRSKPSSSATKA